MLVNSYSLTDIGRKRPHNEDSVLENTRLNLFAVADGMGGLQAGEVASKIAVDTLCDFLELNYSAIADYEKTLSQADKHRIFELLEEAAARASAKIFAYGLENSSGKGMGSTLSALLLAGNGAFIAHVGDSRVYLYRFGKLYQLTEDHTVVNDKLKKGLITKEQAKNYPYKNVITRAVGIMENGAGDTFFLELAENDRFLLCSDGLHGYCANGVLAEALSEKKLDAAARRLIDYANDCGGRDNITVALAEASSVKREKFDVSTRIDVLQTTPLFESLEYQDLMRLVNVSKVYEAKFGECVVREGESGDNFYIILSGEVEVSSQGMLIAKLSRGGHFGEMALIDDMARSATVTVTKDADLLCISRGDFSHLLKREPKVASVVLLNISRTMSERLRETTRALTESRLALLKKGPLL